MQQPTTGAAAERRAKRKHGALHNADRAEAVAAWARQRAARRRANRAAREEEEAHEAEEEERFSGRFFGDFSGASGQFFGDFRGFFGCFLELQMPRTRPRAATAPRLPLLLLPLLVLHLLLPLLLLRLPLLLRLRRRG